MWVLLCLQLVCGVGPVVFAGGVCRGVGPAVIAGGVWRCVEVWVLLCLFVLFV